MSENPNPITPISDLNARIQAIVQKETIGKPLWVSGVIEGKRQSARGHIYFRLEDDPWSIDCVLYDNVQGNLGFTPQNGMEVEALGEIRVYDRKARLEFQVQQMRVVVPRSIPDFLDAEAYLRNKGLWGQPKKELPHHIDRIALVTSRNSDAVNDFKEVYQRKSLPDKSAQILLEDVPLEGELAPAKIAQAIRHINDGKLADVIVLTRGGGRASQLATFNDPLIAEAIIQSKIPVITGIGHESDQTFADKVADGVGITPTDAADKIIQLQARASKPTIPCAKLFGMISAVTALALLLIQVIIG
jgi:exodeoxyribonuclease VII large subunit